tara:strand:+ start:27645 stop:27767 length:123 start_codon:yes stop_codon:yes gene_type:complete
MSIYEVKEQLQYLTNRYDIIGLNEMRIIKECIEALDEAGY